MREWVERLGLFPVILQMQRQGMRSEHGPLEPRACCQHSPPAQGGGLQAWVGQVSLARRALPADPRTPPGGRSAALGRALVITAPSPGYPSACASSCGGEPAADSMGFTCHEGTCKGSSTKRFIRALRSLVKVRYHTGSDRHARLISSHLSDSLSCASHVVLSSGRAVEKRQASPAVRDRRRSCTSKPPPTPMLSWPLFASAVATGSYPGVTLTMYSRPEAHLDLFGTPEAAQPLPAPPGRLSAKQLAIRRGAALGAATGTLVVGLVIRVLTARP